MLLKVIFLPSLQLGYLLGTLPLGCLRILWFMLKVLGDGKNVGWPVSIKFCRYCAITWHARGTTKQKLWVATTPTRPQWPATETQRILEEVRVWLQATTGNLLSQVAIWLWCIHEEADFLWACESLSKIIVLFWMHVESDDLFMHLS